MGNTSDQTGSITTPSTAVNYGAITTKAFINELAVREALATMIKDRIASNPFQAKPDGAKDPVVISLELGLSCVALMLNYGLLTEEEQSRLANRVNVLLRAHPVLALPVQVKE